jgi:hypothetical protein
VATRPAGPSGPRTSRPGLAVSSHREASGAHDVFPPGAYSPEGVDLTLVDAWLDMSPEERLDALQEMLDFVALARRGRPSEAP